MDILIFRTGAIERHGCETMGLLQSQYSRTLKVNSGFWSIVVATCEKVYSHSQMVDGSLLEADLTACPNRQTHDIASGL